MSRTVILLTKSQCNTLLGSLSELYPQYTFRVRGKSDTPSNNPEDKSRLVQQISKLLRTILSTTRGINDEA